MPNYLIGGPAGGGKSAAARELATELAQPVIIEFQEFYAAVLGLLRDPSTGRYPPRNEADGYAMSVAEYTRRAAITVAVENDLDTIVSNSDGNPERRQQLLGLLGPGATERIVDPGRIVVESRLADAVTGLLSPSCDSAVSRWYGEAREVEHLQIELRQTANELHGVLIAEGRAASGGRNELFTPNSVEWPDSGVDILGKHQGAVETRVIPERQADGSITFSAGLTDGLREAWNSGRQYMSVEFHALKSRTVRAGTREIQRALVTAGALVKTPEYDVARAEIREQVIKPTVRTLWL